MKKNIILVIAIASLFVSCHHEVNLDLSVNLEIRSNELRNAILEYDSIIHKSIVNEQYILTVFENSVNDTVSQYTITYDLGTAGMQLYPVSMAKVNDKYVIFARLRNPYGLVVTNKCFQQKIAGRYFPDEYRILKSGKSINTYITNDDIEMKLTFCKGKLIKKWITPTYR